MNGFDFDIDGDSIDLPEPTADNKSTGERDWTCRKCGEHLKGSWGHCPECCLTFPQEAGYTRHRTRDRSQVKNGGRIIYGCLTAEQHREANWQQDPEHAHVWRLPAPKPREETP